MEDFIKRLGLLMEYYSIPASALADKLGVQRSGISHLISGRNKPSLDFVIKLAQAFPEVDLYWLLNGNGAMLKNTSVERETSSPETISTTEQNPPPLPTSDPTLKKRAGGSDIEKVIVLYKDGTFATYSPGSSE